MAIVNKHFGFVFLAEPHTGSRAVRDALLALKGSVETNGDHHLGLYGCYKRGYLSEIEADEFTIFAVIRNPYDLLVTRWWYHARGTFIFKDWVSDIAWETEQEDNTLFWRTKDVVDWFIRYEHLEVGLNTVLDGVNAPSVDIPVVGRTVGKPDWRDMWFPALDRVARFHYPDIERYDYRAKYDGLDCQGVEDCGQIITKSKA